MGENTLIRRITASENGGKGGLAMSWPAVKIGLTVVTLAGSVSWGLFMFIRSADQRLIAEQMAATRELIRQVEARGAEDRQLIRVSQDKIEGELREIRVELRDR